MTVQDYIIVFSFIAGWIITCVVAFLKMLFSNVEFKTKTEERLKNAEANHGDLKEQLSLIFSKLEEINKNLSNKIDRHPNQ